jgi:hypothetical protein
MAGPEARATGGFPMRVWWAGPTFHFGRLAPDFLAES